MNCRFVVIATAWSEEEKKQVKIICGMFPRYIEAELFAKAYSEHYKTTAEIKDVNCLCL